MENFKKGSRVSFFRPERQVLFFSDASGKENVVNRDISLQMLLKETCFNITETSSNALCEHGRR
jgi:hypothetical protein